MTVSRHFEPCSRCPLQMDLGLSQVCGGGVSGPVLATTTVGYNRSSSRARAAHCVRLDTFSLP